jgi:hypothetical protein
MSKSTEDERCATCGHSRRWHREDVITTGYGEGGRCGWFKDPMYSPTEECSRGAGGKPCQGFVSGSGKA